jgi:hypothetical protein
MSQRPPIEVNAEAVIAVGALEQGRGGVKYVRDLLPDDLPEPRGWAGGTARGGVAAAATIGSVSAACCPGVPLVSAGTGVCAAPARAGCSYTLTASLHKACTAAECARIFFTPRVSDSSSVAPIISPFCRAQLHQTNDPDTVLASYRNEIEKHMQMH